jgi:hypothetical protein
MQRKLYILLPVLLGGCFYNQTDIQGDYEVARKGCQAYAESRIDDYEDPQRAVSEKGRNAELVTLFSDCMAKSGWQVATPKRVKTTTAAPKPAAPQPQPQPQPQTQAQPALQPASPLTPSGGTPPLRQPVNPNAATYQPAPAQQAPVPYYGTPGRTF